MMNAHPLTKPRLRPRGPDNFAVDFGRGRTASLFRRSDDEWAYETPGKCARPTWGFQEALTKAWMASIEAPPPIDIPREEIAAEIARVDGNATECTKLMRRWLKLRTGIAWSATRGRGTAASWLRIHVPAARRVDSDGKPTTKSWGYIGAADRALLGVILDDLPHNQGVSIRTERGVRAFYLWKISGHAAPDDLVVAPPSWD